MYTFRSLLGGTLYDLPSGLSIGLGFELSDISGISVTYPVAGVNADKIVEDATIIAYNDGVEIKNGRWWLLGSTGESLTDDQVVKTIAGKSLFRIFERVVVHVPAAAESVVYVNKTPGFILNDLFTAAQARGAMTGMTWNFTATHDSEGVAWPSSYNIEIPITDTYLKIIQGMFDNTWAEFEFNGTVFSAVRPPFLGADLTASVELVAGRDYQELPYKTSIEERAHYALVAGDEGTRSGYAAPAATGPYGREEIGATQGGVSATTTLDALAYSLIQAQNKQDLELTRKLALTPLTPIPGVAFNVGDYITERVGSTRTSYRVRAMALGIDDDGMTASIVLNDRILPTEVKQRRRWNAATKGTASTRGGTGTPKPIPTNPTDTTTPSPPTSLSGTSTAYLDSFGGVHAYVDLTWVAPTTNVDASALTDLAGYEVQYRRNASGMLWSTVRVANLDALTTIAGLDMGTSYQFRVRAYDTATPTAHYSGWSTTLTMTTAYDTIPPSTPSTPTVLIGRGTATIYWDGKTNLAGPMEPDFHKVEVHRSLVNAFTPSSATLLDALYAAGAIVRTDQTYNTPYYYKLVAKDTSGNSSGASVQVTATTTPLVTGDLADLIITAGKLAANSVESDKIDVGAVNAEHIALGVFNSNLVADPSFEEDYPINSDFLPSTRPDRWRVCSAGFVGGAWSASRQPVPRSGLQALQLVVANTDSINTHVQVMSPVFPVTPGKTYVAVAYAGKRNSSTTARFYMRVAGGATEALSDFPADSTTNDVGWSGEDVLFAEDKDVPYTGATHTPGLYEAFKGEFTVPAGINFCALRFFSWKPSAGLTLLIDDVSVVEKGMGATEITSAGVRLFGTDGVEMAAMVSNRANIFSVSKDGASIAGISDEGALLGKTLSVEGYDSNADEVPDSGFEIYGTEFLEWLNEMPRGILAWENFVNDTTGLAAETGYGEIGFTALPGRLYRVQVRGFMEPDVQAETLVGRLRMTWADAPTAAASPTTTSTVLLQTNIVATTLASAADADFHYSDFAIFYNETAVPRNVRILHTMDAGGTANPVMRSQGGGLSNFTSLETGTILVVEDVGPYRAQGGAYNTGGAAVSPVQTYTKTWTSTSARSYMGSGAQDSSQGPSDMKQGYSSYDGNSKSLWIFPSLTATLAGATITKIRAYLYANHWYNNSGGTAYVKVHGYSSYPASSPSMTTALTSSSWPKPGGRWVTLPSSLHAGFISGTYKGIGVGPAPSNSTSYYGRFNRDGAKLEITYKK